MKPKPMRSRDRHGRGMRGRRVAGAHRGRPPASPLVELVAGTVEYLRRTYPNELGALQWHVLDLPPLRLGADEVPRYSCDRLAMSITIYRLPIERLDHVRRTELAHELQHVEEYVFHSVAELLGRDPLDFLRER